MYCSDEVKKNTQQVSSKDLSKDFTMKERIVFSSTSFRTWSPVNICIRTLTLLFLLSAHFSWAAPKRETPTSPCDLGKAVKQEDYISMELDIVDELLMTEKESKQNFKKSLAKTMGMARRLRNFVLRKRLRHKSLKRLCLKDFSLRGMALQRSSANFNEEWFQTLPDDFRRLAVLEVFVNEARVDTESYSSKLLQLSRHLRETRCWAEITSHFKNQAVDSLDITSSVMPAQYKNMRDQAVVDRRNCLIARDALRVLGDMKKWYK